MIQKTEAVVLKRRDFRETSLILTLFTKEFGKINALAKGVRVSCSRWGTAFPLFSHNFIVFYEKRGLHLITEGELLDSFRDSLLAADRNAVANYFIELTDLITSAEDKNSELFEMLLSAFHLLAREKDLARLVHIFEIRLLKLSGFMPRIDACVYCKKRVLNFARFSNHLGGLLCRDCLTHDRKASFVNHGTVSTLNHIVSSPDERLLSRLKMTLPIKNNLGAILKGFLAYHLDRFPRSYGFMHKALLRS